MAPPAPSAETVESKFDVPRVGPQVGRPAARARGARGGGSARAEVGAYACAAPARRALDEAIAELRHLLKHTAPARGGAVQGGMLFLPSGLTLKLSATPPSKLSSAVAGWAGADNAEMVEAAQPSRSAVQLVAAAQLLLTCAFESVARSPDAKALLVGHWQGSESRASVAEALRFALEAAEKDSRGKISSQPVEGALALIAADACCHRWL